MTPECKIKLKNLLYKHEGFRQFPYPDTSGHTTIGIGRNLVNKGISLSEAFYLLEDDILYFSSKLPLYLDFFNELSENRQIVLIDMAFNLGIQGLLGFRNMLKYLQSKDYEKAAEEMLVSKWADQVKERATDLAHIIRTDEL